MEPHISARQDGSAAPTLGFRFDQDPSTTARAMLRMLGNALEHGDTEGQCLVACELARALAAADRPADARPLLLDARRAAAASEETRTALGRVNVTLALCDAIRGDASVAAEQVRSGLSLLEGAPALLLAEAHLGLAECRHRAGDSEGAVASLVQADALLGSGVEPPRERLRRRAALLRLWMRPDRDAAAVERVLAKFRQAGDLVGWLEGCDRLGAGGSEAERARRSLSGAIPAGPGVGASALDEGRLQPPEMVKGVLPADLEMLAVVLDRTLQERDLDRLLAFILEALIETSGAERACVLICEQDRIVLKHGRTAAGQAIEETELRFSQRLAQWVISSGKILLAQNALEDPLLSTFTTVQQRLIRSLLCLPMSVRGQSVGALYLEHTRKNDTFTPRRLELAKILARYAALAIERSMLHSQVTRDPVTGLYNSPYLETQLQRQCRLALRDDRPLAFLNVLVGGHGLARRSPDSGATHHALREVGRRICNVVRDTDFVAHDSPDASPPDDRTGRLPGNAFGVILPGTDEENAARAATRILSACREATIDTPDGPAPLTASIGVAVFPKHARESRLLKIRAAEATRDAQASGRGGVSIWSARLQETPPEAAAPETRPSTAVIVKETLGDRRWRELQNTFESIVGQSPAIRKLFPTLERVAESPYPVVVEGETGTGKELVAREIHRISPRGRRPFVEVNCAALPETLLESELFGHVRGAYTGAHEDREGLFRLADGGTLFLDEIGEMSEGLQKKFLRVLQDGFLRPIGGKESIHVDVRIIAATNRNLEQMVREGRFREDLYYRLQVSRLLLPPLRERREDIPLLLEHLLQKVARATGTSPRGVSREALRLLLNYAWPGNIREMENVVKSAVLLCDARIEPRDLPPALNPPPEPPPDLPPPGPGSPVEVMWRGLIEKTLRAHAGNIKASAKALGISRTTLYARMRELGLARSERDVNDPTAAAVRTAPGGPRPTPPRAPA